MSDKLKKNTSARIDLDMKRRINQFAQRLDSENPISESEAIRRLLEVGLKYYFLDQETEEEAPAPKKKKQQPFSKYKQQHIDILDKNEQVLEELYKVNGEDQILKTKLLKRGYREDKETEIEKERIKTENSMFPKIQTTRWIYHYGYLSFDNSTISLIKRE